MFWDKYTELCEKKGIRPRKLAEELGMSPAGVTRWKNGTVPRNDVLEQIAARLDVPTSYLVDDNEYFVDFEEKRSMFKKLTALPQRWISLHSGYDLDNHTLVSIADLCSCSIFFLTSDKDIEYVPTGEFNMSNLLNMEAFFAIFEILDSCADTDLYRTLQIQLSRVVLYNLGKKKYTLKKLSAIRELSTAKLKFLMNNKEDADPTVNYGFNFSDITALVHHTGLSYIYLFTGVEGSFAEMINK